MGLSLTRTLAWCRIPLLIAAVGLSFLAARNTKIRADDNRAARARDRHLARTTATQACARIGDAATVWALDRSRVAGQPFTFTVRLQSATGAPCQARVRLDAGGFALDPPGRTRTLTADQQGDEASWELTPTRPGRHDVVVRALDQAMIVGFDVHRRPPLPTRTAVFAALACAVLAFTVGVPRWWQRRREDRVARSAA
jgi:hypothetical protein